jgi:hypothetical protein
MRRGRSAVVRAMRIAVRNMMSFVLGGLVELA